MLSSVVAGHVRPTNWLGNCQGVPPPSYLRRGRVTDENLCVFEKVFGGETAYLWVRKSHVYGCDTPLRRPGSWRNNFLRRRTWRLRHDTLVRRRVSQRLVFATSRLRQALVRQGPGTPRQSVGFPGARVRLLPAINISGRADRFENWWKTYRFFVNFAPTIH